MPADPILMRLGKIKKKIENEESLTEKEINFLLPHIHSHILSTEIKKIWPEYVKKIKENPPDANSLFSELNKKLKSPEIKKEELVLAIKEAMKDFKLKKIFK